MTAHSREPQSDQHTFLSMPLAIWKARVGTWRRRHPRLYAAIFGLFTGIMLFGMRLSDERTRPHPAPIWTMTLLSIIVGIVTFIAIVRLDQIHDSAVEKPWRSAAVFAFILFMLAIEMSVTLSPTASFEAAWLLPVSTSLFGFVSFGFTFELVRRYKKSHGG